jgi:hypothetical protein
MPGRRRRSFRTGDLAEGLGIQLLRGIAFVAEVARPEDVGLDAVATLLREDPDGNCYAEDSFLIQLKSGTKRKVTYKDSAIPWFLGQRQPMFIGHVSLQNSKIELYSTVHALRAAVSIAPARLELRLCENKKVPEYVYDNVGSYGNVIVWLGPPVLTYSLSDLGDELKRLSYYSIMRRFLTVAHLQHELFQLRQASHLRWKTNDAESISCLGWGVVSMDGQLMEIAAKLDPPLKALILEGVFKLGREPLLEAARALATELKKLGCNMESGNMASNMLGLASTYVGTSAST